MSERYTPEQIALAERNSAQREAAGYYDDEKVVALTAERDALLAEVARLREALMRVHNFPSHPGGHVADRSGDVECPEDWRDGWITAVYLVQRAALSAPIRDSRKTAALSAGDIDAPTE